VAVSLALNLVWIAEALHSTAPSAGVAYSASIPAHAAGIDVATAREQTIDAPFLRAVAHTSPAVRADAHTTTASSPRHVRAFRSVQNRGIRRGAVRTGAARTGSQPSQTLRWSAVAEATYYNVVLWRDGKRVLDLWPTLPRVPVPTTSANHESRLRLSPGRYLWFVYPGYGAKPARQYGALAGSGVLVVLPKGGKWKVRDSLFR
jgi:hypothetical protein